MQQQWPGNINVFLSQTKQGAIIEIAAVLNDALTTVTQHKTPCLLLLSGGSAFTVYEYIDPSSLSPLVTIGVLDERYSTDPKENNMAQLQQTSFYARATEHGCGVIDTTVHGSETQEELATRFHAALVDWKNHNPQGVIIATVGIGPDGHTSGILPFPENPQMFSNLFETTDKLVVGYDADGKNPYRYRVTTTYPFLKGYIDHVFVYAVGENKRDALTKVKSETGTYATTPARVLRDMKDVSLYTDINID